MECQPGPRTSRSSSERSATHGRLKTQTPQSPWSLRRIYLVVSHRYVPRAPSLELYVLPSGGGHLSKFQKSSGAEGDRTPDLCSAIAALSQLSYSPAQTRRTVLELVGPTRRTGSKQRPREFGRGRSNLNLADPPTKSRPNFRLDCLNPCPDSLYTGRSENKTNTSDFGNIRLRLATLSKSRQLKDLVS